MNIVKTFQKLLPHHHNHCHLHTVGNQSVGESLLWLFSAQTITHCLVHVVSFIPILFGLAEWHDHDERISTMAEMVSYSFALNMMLHVGMAVMVIMAEKMRRN